MSTYAYMYTKQGLMPASRTVMNKGEALHISWHPSPITSQHLLPAAARTDILHPAYLPNRRPHPHVQNLSTQNSGGAPQESGGNIS